MTTWVNGYVRTLFYGGPQEGGWWRSHYEPLASLPIDVDPAVVDCDCGYESDYGWQPDQSCSDCSGSGKRRAELHTLGGRLEVEEALRNVEAACAQFKAPRPASSAAGGNDIIVVLEDHFAVEHADPAGCE